MRTNLFRRRLLAAAAATSLLAAGAVTAAAPAAAWKPYTHNTTGDTAWEDATADGQVTIAGKAYPLPARLVQALTSKKAHYDAGVIGPDGFPDLVMGQSVIHPENTGAWLRFVHDSAWAAQGSPKYTDDQELEVLAFAYGFLTHAAGDMWAHTLVNDFAGGIFPSVDEVVDDPLAALKALKHLIIEGYIGDATPGYDGDPTRAAAPGLNEDGLPDVSDDSTPGRTFAAPPDAFVYDVFVARGTDAAGHYTQPLPGQPTADRGPLIEFFYDLRNDLADDAGTNSNWEEKLDAFRQLQDDLDYVIEECSPPPNIVECPIALAIFGVESLAAVLAEAENLVDAAVEELTDAYLAAWVEDIDYGLQHWNQVGLSMTKALFDAQTRRDEQNEECGEDGSETDQLRIDCEDGFGPISTVMEVLGPNFTTSDPQLLSMLGAPDFVGGAIEGLDEISDAIDALVDFPNPISATIAELQEVVRDKVDEAIEETFGFSPQAFDELLKNPTAYLDPIHPPLPLPEPLGSAVNSVGGLYAAGEHERVDTLMGFPQPGTTGAHIDQLTKRLKADSVFDAAAFAPFQNTLTTAKLLLLPADGLNAALSDLSGRDVDTYGSGGNLMFSALDPDPTDATVPAPWLRSIDSDHSWRQDGAPRFPADERDPALNGGNGTMPLYESCVLRPSFRVLFDDWENGALDFPDLGDGVGADPVNDPAAPDPTVTQTAGASFTRADGRKYVAADNAFTLTAADTAGGKGFPAAQVGLRYRVRPGAAAPGPWTTAALGQSISLSGGDGRYLIEVQAADPCHTFDDSDALAAGAVETTEVWLDTTPPVVTGGNPPFGRTYDTDDSATVDYTVDDGDGSGVATQSAVVDGWDGTPGAPNSTRATSDGDPLDMYLFYPGLRTVRVTAADNLGNTGVTPLQWTLHATAVSLGNNLDRALAGEDHHQVGAHQPLGDRPGRRAQARRR